MKRLLIYVFLYMMAVFFMINFFVAPLFNKIAQSYMSPQIASYCRDLFSGSYHLIEAELNRIPVDQWDQALKVMQPHFNSPLAVSPIASVKLQQTNASALAAGDVVVVFEEDMAKLHQQLGETNMVLTMGPIPAFEYNKFLFGLLFSLVVAPFFCLSALIWSWPFSKKLRQISTAAVAFGNGALGVRAKVSPRSSLAPLAGAFNGMADRIQELIHSHKELTHAVSHELRTPLARLRFSMEMLGSAGKFDQREHYLEGMRRDVDELDLLVSELLTYARTDKNYRPQMDAMDLGPWLNDLVHGMDAEYTTVAIGCRISSPDPAVPVQASPRFLERALRNFVRNAVRYAKDRIHVTLKTDGEQVVIHVDDDGPGIPPADRQRIFEPFVRLETQDYQNNDGYGLGLAIVQRVAQWHGGTVSVSDAAIGGARFTLRLPIIITPSSF